MGPGPKGLLFPALPIDGPENPNPAVDGAGPNDDGDGGDCGDAAVFVSRQCSKSIRGSIELLHGTRGLLQHDIHELLSHLIHESYP